MELKKVIFVILAAISLFLIFGFLTFNPPVSMIKSNSSAIKIEELGRAGDFGYTVFSSNGSVSLHLLSYAVPPKNEISILKDNGIAMDNFEKFTTIVKKLEQKGFKVNVITPFAKNRQGVIIVPTGAMPQYIINDIKLNNSNQTFYYIGKKDLLINNGIKKEKWYENLTTEQKNNLYINETTLDAFLEKSGEGFLDDIYQNNWLVTNEIEKNYTSTDLVSTTLTLNISNSSYLRVIYTASGNQSFNDSIYLNKSAKIQTEDVFPSSFSTISFFLNKTNIAPRMVIYKDGKEFAQERITRNLEESFYLKRLNFSEPGDYILRVFEGYNELASGIVHVKNLQIILINSQPDLYTFAVTVDSKKIENEKVIASLNNSTKTQIFFVSSGELVIPAKLQKGNNVLNLQILGLNKSIQIPNNFEDISETYVKYGLPGLILIFLVYALARFARRPTYKLRIGEGAKELRKQVKITPKTVLDLIVKSRKDLGVDGPITSSEFAISLKKYITQGAEVTEGNVEELLKELEKDGKVEHYLDYYQPKGEGDIKKNSAKRRIRDVLIEKGVDFKFKKDKFIIKQFEIGFLGSKFSGTKKSVIVFENQNESDRYFKNLEGKNLAVVRMKQFNGIIETTTLDHLEGLL